MALGLEDLNCVQKKTKEEDFTQKKRVLRPWEGYEKLGNQTRTIAAREAVKKARSIVKKNDIMAEKLRENTVSKTIIKELNSDIFVKEEQFQVEEEMMPMIQKVKLKKSLSRFFKNFL